VDEQDKTFSKLDKKRRKLSTTPLPKHDHIRQFIPVQAPTPSKGIHNNKQATNQKEVSDTTSIKNESKHNLLISSSNLEQGSDKDNEYSLVSLSEESDLDMDTILDEELRVPKPIAHPKKKSKNIIVVDDEETQIPVTKIKTKSKSNNITTNATVNENHTKQQQIPYKYQEDPIRKKHERALLKGRECPHCEKFYEALNQGDHKFDRSKFVAECSRHKEIHSPPQTPPGFWEPGFPSSQSQVGTTHQEGGSLEEGEDLGENQSPQRTH